MSTYHDMASTINYFLFSKVQYHI